MNIFNFSGAHFRLLMTGILEIYQMRVKLYSDSLWNWKDELSEEMLETFIFAEDALVWLHPGMELVEELAGIIGVPCFIWPEQHRTAFRGIVHGAEIKFIYTDASPKWDEFVTFTCDDEMARTLYAMIGLFKLAYLKKGSLAYLGLFKNPSADMYIRFMRVKSQFPIQRITGMVEEILTQGATNQDIGLDFWACDSYFGVFQHKLSIIEEMFANPSMTAIRAATDGRILL
jgi:hypothetical protein